MSQEFHIDNLSCGQLNQTCLNDCPNLCPIHYTTNQSLLVPGIYLP